MEEQVIEKRPEMVESVETLKDKAQDQAQEKPEKDETEKRKRSKKKKSKKEKKLKEEKVVEKEHSSDDEPLILKHGNSSSRSLPNQIAIHMQSPATHSQPNLYLPPSSANFIQQSMAQQQVVPAAVPAPAMQRIASKTSQSSSKSKKSKKSKRDRTQSESGSSNSTKLSGSVSRGSFKSVESQPRKSRQSFRQSMEVSQPPQDFSARPPSRIAPKPDEDDEDDKPLAVVKDQHQAKQSNEISRAGSRKSVTFPVEPVSETKFLDPPTSASEVSHALSASPAPKVVQERTTSLKKKKGILEKIFCCFSGSNEALSPSPVEPDLGLRRTVSVASYRSCDPKATSEYSMEMAPRKSMSTESSGNFVSNRASMLQIALPDINASPLRAASTSTFKDTRSSLDSFDLEKGLDDIMAKYMTQPQSSSTVPASTTRTLPKRPIPVRKSMDMDFDIDEELLQYKSMF